MKGVYYPTQIPFVLSKEFSEAITYTEEVVENLRDFVICVWEMTSRTTEPRTVTNHVIVADGCIDLVVDFGSKDIGFAGMSKTVFDDKITTPAHWMGARMKPGAFQALTGLDASMAMNKFLPLTKVAKWFKKKSFFEQGEKPAKERFIEVLSSIAKDKSPNSYTRLFDKLTDTLPDTAEELYAMMGYSPKQTQRLFNKHFGLTPQMALSILRFQKALSDPSRAMEKTNYYDQAHFAKDFKKHLGITPSELVKLYK